MSWANGYRSPPGWTATRKRILNRDAHVCYICGQDGADQVDHIINAAAGGTHDDHNLAAIHAEPCHRLKTNRERNANRQAPPPPPAPRKRRRPEAHPGLQPG